MNSSSTLTSLAMLKITIDQGGDYLEYLKPFVLHVLSQYHPDPVVDGKIKECILKEFGLEIPERTIQIVIKRLSKKYPLRKQEGVYRIEGKLPDPGITLKRSEAKRHIDAIISGLIEFSQSTGSPISEIDVAVEAICAFLSQFEVPCLRAFLRGTTIPEVEGKRKSDIVLVSKYIIHLQRAEPERFNSLRVMVQGHMLANALLAPDLQNAPKSYEEVTFYFDTPLLVHLLGLEGSLKKNAAEELVNLLNRLGAKLAVFSHTRDEIDKVIQGAAYNLDRQDARGAIIREARRCGKTKSDLLLMKGQINDKLRDYRIEVKETPGYETRFQIDEAAFEEVLQDEIDYYNPRARLFDIKSVRSIYVLRRGITPSMLERAKAVFVTSNSAFAHAAWTYGQKFEQSQEVSTVITDFSLANMAWLKVPMGAPSLPMSEVLAYSYAALEPSQELIEKYIKEIDKLEQQGKITPRDHQLLRSSTLAQDELMNLTLGQEAALTEETITETLRRVSEEIKKEEIERYYDEKEAHRQTQLRLQQVLEEKQKIQKRIYWRCKRKAEVLSRIVCIFVGVALLLGLIRGGSASSSRAIKWILNSAAALLIICTFLNLMIGSTMRNACVWLENHLCKWFFKRESKRWSINLSLGE